MRSFWLVLPESKIKTPEDCGSSVTIHEEPPSAALSHLSSFNWGRTIYKNLQKLRVLMFWLVLPESKIKVVKMCCSLITFHEEPPSAAFPVSNGGEPSTNTWKSRVVMPTLWVIDPVGVSTLSTFGALRWAFPREVRTRNRRFLYPVSY